MSAKKTTKKATKKVTTKKRGRPSLFSPAVASEIIEKLSKGIPMAEICRLAKMPAVRTVNTWMNENAEFSASIARARLDGFDMIAADCLKIADTQKCGKIVKRGPDGTTTTTEDMLGHRKLQIETRLKLLAKWDPKRYGEKLDLAHSGSVDIEVTIGGDDSE